MFFEKANHFANMNDESRDLLNKQLLDIALKNKLSVVE